MSARIITKHTWCPLCEREMTEMPIMYGQMKTRAVICRPCNIFTFRFDPAFDKWRDTDLKIPCPHCHHPEVKWFLRYVDQYLKFICPKCKVVGEGDCNAVIGDRGEVDLEMMDGSSQVPVEEEKVYIPVDKLPTTEENKRKISQKLRRKREQEGN